jgi:puromycin-sensitive aminopeptidase
VSDAAPDVDAQYRLPRKVVPSRYELVLTPNLAAASFEGAEDVTVHVHEPVDEIVLNAIGLEIGEGWVAGPDGVRVEVARVRLDEETERAHLELEAPIDPGNWILHLGFRGTLNDRMRGFYRSTYVDGSGEHRVVATTQFQSTDARRAFPCWDEPDLKAVFAVTLAVEEGHVALSNGPEVGREPSDGRMRVRFGDTMPMSPYLLAFVVGPLEISDPVDVDGVPLRVVHAVGKGNLTAFALEIGAFSLRLFSAYYGIPYPGDKLDMVALPDFAQGAMENLGLITYREAALLVDPASATQGDLQNVADTVAHEIAHMWFGDLVTMRWWNGVWLNEAFATFMELLCVDAFRPDWRPWELFARARSVALEVDALASTRSIEYPVRSPDDASGMFDILTYQKGASVLRMLEQYLGTDRFREGIRRYLNRHRYGNAETSDLWDAIEEATGEPVRRIMDSWIWQGGFPLVSVSTRDGELDLSQHRFRSDGVEDDAVWEVPLLVRHGAGLGAPVEPVLVGPDGVTLAHSPGTAEVVNAGGHGFVRVRYAEDLLERLADALEALPAIERYQLVDDLWASTVAGMTSAAEYCRFARAFDSETDLPVWQALLAGLGWCERLVEGPARERFRGFVRELVRPALDRVGWDVQEGDTDLTKSLRGALFGGLGLLAADPEAIALAREIERGSRSGDGADPSLAAAAISILAATGGIDEFEAFLTAKDQMPTPQRQLRYLYALSEFRDPSLLERALTLALTDRVRPQDAPSLLARALANRDGGPLAWGYIREHWREIEGRLAPSAVIYVAYGLRMLTEPETVEDVQSFFSATGIPQSALQLRQILEWQRVNAAFAARARPELAETFGD